ncbi:hypothetical protein NQ317_008860 [Molorchus minor]|uniref:Integrase catalytic domain-containing protein n=1 Tax=Molorchus minor TaxID=1323400 RepID=A0ABQ9JZ24_9CUCU|nr:hypothetical protein NQ317_008860 [Molorchus minor]
MGRVKKTGRQIVVPKTRVPGVLQEIHGGASGGHLGVTRTLAKLRERFYWVNATKDVKVWCRKCVECAASNGPQRRKKAPMRQYNVGSPFERIAIDVAGPFPESNDGNKYIVVVMDYFSKWVEAYALPNQEASTIADVLVKEWICRFGVPLELHSDQDYYQLVLVYTLCPFFLARGPMGPRARKKGVYGCMQERRVPVAKNPMNFRIPKLYRLSGAKTFGHIPVQPLPYVGLLSVIISKRKMQARYRGAPRTERTFSAKPKMNRREFKAKLNPYPTFIESIFYVED